MFFEFIENKNLENYDRISDLFVDFIQKYNIGFQHIKSYY